MGRRIIPSLAWRAIDPHPERPIIITWNNDPDPKRERFIIKREIVRDGVGCDPDGNPRFVIQDNGHAKPITYEPYVAGDDTREPLCNRVLDLLDASHLRWLEAGNEILLTLKEIDAWYEKLRREGRLAAVQLPVTTAAKLRRLPGGGLNFWHYDPVRNASVPRAGIDAANYIEVHIRSGPRRDIAQETLVAIIGEIRRQDANVGYHDIEKRLMKDTRASREAVRTAIGAAPKPRGRGRPKH